MEKNDITSDVTPAGIDAQYRVAKVLNDLWAARDWGVGDDVKPAEIAALSRLLDSVAETAVKFRAQLEHPGDRTAAARLVTRVRKALGYTYP